MNLYSCRIGDIVMTGDNYGMSPCVCIKERHLASHGRYDVVLFLDLTDGKVHDSGGVSGVYLDDCYYITRVKPEQVEVIKKAWNVNQIPNY